MKKTEILNKAYESINYYCKYANEWLKKQNTNLYSDNEQKALGICYFLNDIGLITWEQQSLLSKAIIHSCLHYEEEQ